MGMYAIEGVLHVSNMSSVKTKVLALTPRTIRSSQIFLKFLISDDRLHDCY